VLYFYCSGNQIKKYKGDSILSSFINSRTRSFNPYKFYKSSNRLLIFEDGIILNFQLNFEYCLRVDVDSERFLS